MSSGDCMQLPPVGAKSHFDKSNPMERNKACGIGHLKFKEFLHGKGPMDDPNADSKSITVVMENVFHQDEGKFKEVLNEICTAKVEYESAQFLMNINYLCYPVLSRRNSKERPFMCFLLGSALMG
jgi:hypothetical protein